MFKIDLHLSFPIPSPQATSILLKKINQPDCSFPINEEALFITHEHELIAIGRDSTFKVISQLDLASCVQRYHVYMSDKHRVQ